MMKINLLNNPAGPILESKVAARLQPTLSSSFVPKVDLTQPKSASALGRTWDQYPSLAKKGVSRNLPSMPLNGAQIMAGVSFATSSLAATPAMAGGMSGAAVSVASGALVALLKGALLIAAFKLLQNTPVLQNLWRTLSNQNEEIASTCHWIEDFVVGVELLTKALCKKDVTELLEWAQDKEKKRDYSGAVSAYKLAIWISDVVKNPGFNGRRAQTFGEQDVFKLSQLLDELTGLTQKQRVYHRPFDINRYVPSELGRVYLLLRTIDLSETRINYDTYEAHTDLGNYYKGQGQWSRAAHHYQQAVEHPLNDMEPWTLDDVREPWIECCQQMGDKRAEAYVRGLKHPFYTKYRPLY